VFEAGSLSLAEISGFPSPPSSIELEGGPVKGVHPEAIGMTAEFLLGLQQRLFRP